MISEIVKRMWRRDMTLKRWAALNNFNYSTTQAVVRKLRGKYWAGKSEKIQQALISQGFATNADFNREVEHEQ